MEATAELRRAALEYCARLRILVEKVSAHEAAEQKAKEMSEVVAGMIDALEPYEECFAEQTFPVKPAGMATTRELFANFWAAVEDNDWYGMQSLLNPVLELESRLNEGGSGAEDDSSDSQ